MVDFDVVDLGDTDHIEVGEKAPDFTRPLVNDKFWEDKSLSEIIEEKYILLIFYSMNGSAPAINTWNKIQDKSWDINIVGISISTPYDHKSFIDNLDLDYQLFSDPKNKIAEKYGVVHNLDGMMGIEEPRPSVFILNEDMVVEHVWVATEWPDSPDIDNLQNKIEQIKD